MWELLLNDVVEDSDDAISITAPHILSIGDLVVQIRESLLMAACHDWCMNCSDARPA